MKTFPEPWNPENLPPPDPGYRYLGKDESKLPTDETIWTDRSHWTSYEDANINLRDTANWTYRRALNVDDPSAPPPEEWSQKGWEVSGPTVEPAKEGEEVWRNGSQWIPAIRGFGYLSPYYIRRPINPSMNTSSKTQLSVNWISLKDRYPTNAEAQAGLWVWHPSSSSLNGGYTQSAKWADAEGFKRCNAGATHFAPVVWPNPPKNLLPEVNGYKASYTKGAETVTFGCAHISLERLHKIASCMNLTLACDGVDDSKPDLKDNRTVQSVTLSSGVTISCDQIKAILDYVEAVDKET